MLKLPDISSTNKISESNNNNELHSTKPRRSVSFKGSKDRDNLSRRSISINNKKTNSTNELGVVSSIKKTNSVNGNNEVDSDINRKSLSFTDIKKPNPININVIKNEDSDNKDNINSSLRKLNISINSDDTKSDNGSTHDSPAFNNMFINTEIINAATKLKDINKKLVINKIIPSKKSRISLEKLDSDNNDSAVLKSVGNVLDIASNLIRIESAQTEDIFSSLMGWDLTFLNKELEIPYIKVHSGFIAPFYVQFMILLFALSIDVVVLLKYFSTTNSNISLNLENSGILLFFTICGILFTLIFPIIAFSNILISSFDFYLYFTIFLGIIISTLRVILITESGLPSHVGLALLLFFYLRGRFKPLCIILLYDLLFTNIWYGIPFVYGIDSVKSVRVFVAADIFMISLDIITCLSAYYYELGNRTSYLSFLQCVHEQQKTQSILDSIFPDHSKLYLFY